MKKKFNNPTNRIDENCGENCQKLSTMNDIVQWIMVAIAICILAFCIGSSMTENHNSDTVTDTIVSK